MVLKTASRLFRLLVEIIVIVIAAIVISFLVRTFVVETYEVPSGSMEDTIQVGDRILSEKITYYFRSPEKGEIVTFVSPIQSDESTDGESLLSGNQEIFVKRVIATEGDVVNIFNGNLYVNGELLEEDYVKDGDPTYSFTTTYQGIEISYPYTVPEGEIWVMGDNRTNSRDSRYFGPVDVESVTGRVFFRYWPFSSFGFM